MNKEDARAYRVMCQHCHSMNADKHSWNNRCWHCGHNFRVPLADCDCEYCMELQVTLSPNDQAILDLIESILE